MAGSLAERINEIVERVAAGEGVEVVDVELKGGGASRVLRIFIDKPEGVSHADCEAVSQQVGTILDIEDVIPGGRYHLEVSSPGVERKLSKPRDFERFIGRKVRITLSEPVEQRRQWEGALRGFADDVIELESDGGAIIRIALGQVKKANLKFEW